MVFFNQRKGDTDEQVNNLKAPKTNKEPETVLMKIEYIPSRKCFSLNGSYL